MVSPDIAGVRGEYLGYQYLIFCAEIPDARAFYDAVSSLEEEGSWIQYVPCDLVAGLRCLEVSIRLGIRDFARGRSIARKLNLQILLRLFARTQVKEVLEIIGRSGRSKCFVIVVSKRDPEDVLVYLRRLCEPEAHISSCIARGRAIKLAQMYGISWDIIESIANAKGIGTSDALEMFVIERIATLGLFKS